MALDCPLVPMEVLPADTSLLVLSCSVHARNGLKGLGQNAGDIALALPITRASLPGVSLTINRLQGILQGERKP